MNWIVLAGSLAAVLMLAAAARMLRLGGDERIRTVDQAMAMAAEADVGFDPVAAIVDRAGIAAIVRGADGRHMLIRRHGAMFAARILKPPFFARLDRRFLTLGADDAMFGRITLDLGKEAAIWARRIGQATGQRVGVTKRG